MRKPDRRALERYVRTVADAMELRDWTFRLATEPPSNSDVQASINNIYGQRHGVIRVATDFRDLPPRRQREVIVHELVHAHLEPACNMIFGDLLLPLGTPAERVFTDAFRRQIEYSVDALARALAKHLPLIEWPD